ncbi:peptidoglycan-binding domain-containing protein [Defluviicoccus vanus]|uniref:peptidoglycan-binding domain-containing protein n=1 Tax=Defluviicoccus vanus TaxID=111831 RepID=UPI001CBA6914|nr:peptidoglycan-binding domain-containing protein [Defluviicoccus vanus]
MTLRGLLEGARDEWKGQPGTTLALTELPANDVYLRGDAAVLGARAAAAKAPDDGVSDVERQMSGPERRRLQSRLQALGYYPGPIDGQFGVQTRDAIRKFQAANGLASTGRLGIPEATRLLFFDSKPAVP